MAQGVTVDFNANLARFSGAVDKAVADLNKFQSNAERVSANISKVFNATFAGISIASVTAYGKSVIDAADKMNDLSQSVGIGIKQLAGYQLAANQSGTSIEAVAKGIKGLSGYMVDHADKLRAAGITARDADGALMQLADLFAAMPDGIEKTDLAVQLFGKSGLEMIPMLNQGAAGLEAAREKAEEYAKRLDELAPKADEFNDKIEELALQSKAAGMNITDVFLPGLIGLAQSLNDIAKGGDKARDAIDWLIDDSSVLPYQMRLSLQAARAVKDTFFSKAEAGNGWSQYDGPLQFDWAGNARAAGAAEALARARKLREGKGPKEHGRTAAEIERGMPDWIKTHQSDKWKDILAAQERDVARLTEKYKELGDPLKQYRDALVEISKLRQDDKLSAEEQFQAEQAVMRAMEDTREQMNGLKVDGKDAFAELTQAVEGWGDAFTDTFVDAVMSGKASFKDMTDSIIRDLLRMQVQAQITKPLFEALNGAIAHVAGGGSIFGPTGIFASKGLYTAGGLDAVNGSDLASDLFSGPHYVPMPSFAVGTSYVPHDMIAKIHEGEEIIPAAKNRGWGWGAPQFSISVENTARGVDVKPTVRENNRGGYDIRFLVKEAVLDDYKRGGDISRATLALTGTTRQAL